MALAAGRAAADDPAYEAGWAAGALSAEFGVEAASVTVAAGTATVDAPLLGYSERRSAARLLLTHDGIVAVRFADDSRLYTRAADDGAPKHSYSAFPHPMLFEPLLADPRWPQNSGAIVRHFRSSENLVADMNVGDTFGLVGAKDWQFGVEGGVFGQYDMQTQHDNQLTDDWEAGFDYSRRFSRRWTTMARVYHISTHTGDEFLLANPGFNRIKQSFEALDYRASYDAGNGWRFYGGPGYIWLRLPKDMKPLYAQAGVEWTDSWAWRGLLRPVAAVDLQKHQNYGWGATNVSARAGFQIEHRSQASRRVLLMLEYYDGRDYNGQFYVNPDQFLGLGFHFFF